MDKRLIHLTLILILLLMASCSIRDFVSESDIHYIYPHEEILWSRLFSDGNSVKTVYTNADSTYYYSYMRSLDRLLPEFAVGYTCMDYANKDGSLKGLIRNGNDISEIEIKKEKQKVLRSWSFVDDQLHSINKPIVETRDSLFLKQYALYRKDGKGIFFVNNSRDKITVYHDEGTTNREIYFDQNFASEYILRRPMGEDGLIIWESDSHSSVKDTVEKEYHVVFLRPEGEVQSYLIQGINLFIEGCFIDELDRNLYLSEYHYNENGGYESWIHCYDKESELQWSYKFEGKKEPKYVKNLISLDDSTLFFAGSYQNFKRKSIRTSEFWHSYVYGTLNKNSGEISNLVEGRKESYSLGDVMVLDEKRIFSVGYGNPLLKSIGTRKTLRGKSELDLAKRYPAYLTIELENQ